MLADEAIDKLNGTGGFDTVLDVGPGGGAQAIAFADAGKEVAVVDLVQPKWSDPRIKVHVGDFAVLAPRLGRYDCIWLSHVLEHQRDPQAFLRAIHHVVHAGSLIALSVPPRHDIIVPGHLTLWNGGLLLYHLAMAGFDCRKAAVRSYGYNVSAILRYGGKLPPARNWQEAAERMPDVLRLSETSYRGDVYALNW